MNNKERIINTVLGKPTDRAPYILYFGPWDETVERWKQEGFDESTDIAASLGYDSGFWMIQGVNLGFCPAFSTEVIRETDTSYISRNEFGAVRETLKSNETIPRYLEYPVKDREDWEKLKRERLDPNDERRFPASWKEDCKRYRESDCVIQLGDFPYGLFGTVRELMGVENLLLSFYDDPELIHDMMDTLTDFWLAIYEKVVQDVKVDCIHIWEDMSGKQGPLISPDMMREFMVPNYQKIKAFCRKHDIPILMLDTDGNCEKIMPVLIEGGINLLVPFEVAAGSDVVAYREKEEYENLAMMGGIDKQKIALGRDEIDRELERIRPLLGGTRYLPALDHLIQPEISWEDFCYYSRQLKRMIEEERRDEAGK
ncbi:MAG: hypothetical protein MR332_00900 [Fusicatenibacter sp.]|nr:hypothetical protein [Fusicatenibacter sp.]